MTHPIEVSQADAEALMQRANLPDDMVLAVADAAGVAPATARRRAAFADLVAKPLGVTRVNGTRVDAPTTARPAVADLLVSIATGAPASDAIAAALDDAFRGLSNLPVSPAFIAAIRLMGLDPQRTLALAALVPQGIEFEAGEARTTISISDDDPPSLIGGTAIVDQLLWIEANGTLWLDTTLPGTVLNALAGQPLAAAIEHPGLAGLDLRIVLADHEHPEGRMRIVTRSDRRSTVADAAGPAPRAASGAPTPPAVPASSAGRPA